MSSLANFMKEQATVLSDYHSGQVEKVGIGHGSAATVNHLSKLQQELKETDFVQHFKSLNETIELTPHFVGSLLRCSFDKASIYTSNPDMIDHRGISNGALLIAALPNSMIIQNNLPAHFILLRVVSKDIENDGVADGLAQYDSFALFNDKNEVHNNTREKRTTQVFAHTLNFSCHVLGMFYEHPNGIGAFDFSPQIDMLLSASNYFVFKPDDKMLNCIINTQMILDAKLGKPFDYFEIGEYRETESEAFLQNVGHKRTKVYESISIFMNSRTANFGNTRFGKSNLNKVCISNIIQYNHLYKDNLSKRIGMLIYDENGEYYHVNAQDGTSLYEKHKDLNEVFRYTLRANENDNLMLNFYLSPPDALSAMKILLDKDGGRPIYIESFLSVDIPSLEEFAYMLPHKRDELRKNGEQEFLDAFGSDKECQEEVFKTQLFWALLYKSGFAYQSESNNHKLRTHFFDWFTKEHVIEPFRLPKQIIDEMNSIINKEQNEYQEWANAVQEHLSVKQVDSLEHAFLKMNKVLRFFIDYYLFNKTRFKGGIWERLDPLFEMFNATASKGGYKKLYALRDMHSANSKNNMYKLIEDVVDKGNVCILDLSTTTNARAKKFYAEKIDTWIFKQAEKHFSANLTKEYPMILLNYEEAHNLFPVSASNNSIYMKLAREGAKMQLGIVYNTQFVTSIYGELKSLTENTFVGYTNNQHEIADLANVNYAFRHWGHDIMTIRRVGYMTVLTKNRRFPIRVQIKKFE